MNIDIESIKQALTALGMALSAFRQAKELLPEGSKKENVDEALKQAEQQLKLAESQTAHSLGYELCKNHFPPDIMLSSDNQLWKCPNCGNERNTGPAGIAVDIPVKRETFFLKFQHNS